MEIKSLEKRYQRLYSDFQAGKIDEEIFISEVDKLQFQDRYGRYWMLGAQTGTWHYYDGQNWHQADPNEADKLPFVDEHGRYWQRGVKSGDWYYYEPETEEWVKPGQDDDPAPPTYYGDQQWQGRDASSTSYQSRLQPQTTDTGPGMPSQLDGELFQDDEGRYWAVGAKTGQWYFYDHDGWHPAHEFQSTIAAQPSGTQPYYPQTPQPTLPYTSQPYQSPPTQVPYQPAQGYTQPYSSQEPQQPIYQQAPPSSHPSQGYGSYGFYETPPPTGQTTPPQQFQNYVTPSGQERQAQFSQSRSASQPTSPGQDEVQTETPGKPSSSEPNMAQMPKPPQSESKSGSWYYFDGEQWLKYSSDEPEEAPPSTPKMVIDQESKLAKAEAKSKSESVEAELFEDDEPPVEVVDVEVITVLEAEPEPKPEENTGSVPEPPRDSSPSSLTESENVRPRRSSRPVAPPRPRPKPAEPQRRLREATPSDTGRPVAPRKKETAHEPTIIIPTGSTASKISTPAPSRASQTARPGLGDRRRRAREDTAPISPVPSRESSSGVPAGSRHRQVTQPLPPASSAVARADTAQLKAVTSARQAIQQKPEAVAGSETKSTAGESQTQKTGFTFGDVLRSLPSTVWTFAGGVVLLLVCAFGLIFAGSWLQDSDSRTQGLVAGQIPTPTLDAGPPDASPTPGPTPTDVPEPEATIPASVNFETFSSPTLGFTVEYPEDWQQKEESLWAIFSPSTDGLDPENLNDSAIWIGIPADRSAAIAELLTGVLSDFPLDAETLNEGTISIASQTWTSAQIRYDDENFDGQGIATLAVTSKDDVGYYLVAAAPAEKWNSVQPLFQEMINSFRFASEAVAQATSQITTEGDEDTTDAKEETLTSSDTDEEPEAAAAPDVTATPLTYVVQAGDTLLGIAIEFDVDVDLLASENNIESPESLQVGQELTIPFTAEELADFNASGGSVSQTEDSVADAGSDAAVDSDAAASEEASIAVDAPSEEPSPPTEAAPVSGRIAYPAFNPGTNNYDIWVADLATGEQTVIASQASQPAFNRDGSSLAYRSWSLDSRGIFFKDFIGGRGGQVTRFVEDGLPTWAPDGFSFAFASRREGDRVPRVYIGNQLGEGTFSIGFQGEYPSTLPDGRLVVKGCLPTGDCGIYVMGASGGGETKISGDGDTAPAASPDGNKIAFMSAGRGATNWEIWVMNADGSNAQRLTENGSNEGLPTWSPDGRSIAYVSDQGGVWAVWVMNADGSNQRKLFNMMGSPDGYILYDKDNSRGWLEERISWAP